MCVLAGSVVLSRRSSAAAALEVDRGVTEVSQLVRLRDGLRTQQSAAQFDVRFTELKVTRAVASTFLGFDTSAEVVPARLKADAAIHVLGTRSPVATSVLSALYGKIDGGEVSPQSADQQFGRYVDTIGLTIERHLDALARAAQEPALSDALESLRATNMMMDAGTPQVVDLSVIWFPSPGQTVDQTSAVLTDLGSESIDYAEGVARLQTLGGASVRASLKAIAADPQVRAFDDAVAQTVGGNQARLAATPVDLAKIGSVFRGFPTRDAMLERLVVTATAAVNTEARRVARSERQGFETWLVLAATMALFSLVTALRLARSISRPLKGLADYAHKINEGELDALPVRRSRHEPRETRMALSVFTELVSNLQLMDAKANALALCEFDNPVLGQPLPGRLGRSLESSVALLSGSIVERDELQTHLAHQATHDSLTAISNRPAAITAIEAAMHRSARSGATTAILFIDLNEFKAVNDSHGHEAGDEVLRQVAARLTHGLRMGDFVARLGGDEFVIVSEGVDGVADATDIARRVIDAISAPIDVHGTHLTIGAAVGVALTLDGPEEPLRLLSRADAAMYRAKAHDRSAIEIFDAGLQRQMLEREDIEVALMTALGDPDGGGLRLCYQPVLDTASGAMVGAEALIRWDRPGHGLLAPDSFIPIAEATSLIIDVDCWVMAEATRQLVAWSEVPELAEVPVAVNISGRHLLSRQLPGHITEVLQRSGIDPRRLTIEITETVLLSDLISAAAELEAVRALGVKVAIDDFGTGYTSLAHLQQLPIDTIKIDRSFISQMNVRRGSSLVRMVTDLGHAIDINIVAEGVETGDELAALQAMGADHIQGFLLSRPLDPSALTTWVQGRSATGGGAFASVPVPA
jgi:diguanylate cyclase (GGDEF)-like protein